MKKIYILSFLMLLMQVAIGQVKFEYDAAGNRTKRTLSTTPTYNLAISNQTGLSNAIAAGGNNLGSFTVVSSNVNWNITGVPSWASISTSSGVNGSTTVNVTFTANSTTSARSATITVSGDNGVSNQTISISQLGTQSSSTCPADEVVVGNQGGGEVVIKHFDNYYILCTKSVSGSVTRYVPRGKNYWTWSGFTKNSNVDQYYACINVNDSDWYGLANPLPSGYVPTGWLSSTFNDGDGNPVFYFYKNTTNTLSLSQSSWSAIASSTSTTVSVSSNVSWAASSNATSWLTVSPTSGSNINTLTISAQANTGTSARTGTITVTGGGITQTVAVSQAGVSGNVNVVSNGNCYTIKSKQTNNYMQLMGDGTIQQQVANNQNTQIWKAVSSGSSYQFVSQSNQQYLKVDNYNEGTLVTSGTSGNNLWNLVSNSDSYRISTPTNITWDLQGYGTGQYLQLYGSTSEDFANHRLWTFTQATCSTSVAPTLTVSSNSWSAVAGSTSTTVNVSSNISWTASSNATSWLTVSPGSGSNNGTLTISALANTGTMSRTGTITLTGGGLTQTVTVTQAGATTGSCPADEVVVGNQGGGEVVIKHFDNYYILCTKSVSGSVTRYVPRGKNYWTWSGFTKNSNVDQYYACINVNDSDWYGLANPLPSGYVPTGWLSSTFNDGDGNPVFYFYKNTTNTLSLSQSSWSASAGSTSTTVNVSSNVSWTASSNATSWLIVSLGSGSNNGTLTISAQSNTGTTARTGTITVSGGGLSQTVTVTQSVGSSCGNTPQNYCLTGTIPANQFRYLSNNAYTNVAGPRSSLDGGSPPFYGNAGWIQGYNGVSGSIVYPTNQNDINLPVVISGYRIDLWWPSANSKVLKLYVNGVQKWSQTTTCQDYCQFYPDFSSVVSGDRVYFEVTENATARVAVSNDVFEKQAEVKEDVLVVSPNPTDGKVKASFYLRESQSVRLSVIDTQGRTISIYDKDANAGTNSIDLDLQQQASGTYIIQLQVNNKQLVTKVMKL